MWTIFKVFIEFVTILLPFYVLVFWPRSMRDLSSLTRDRTRTPCVGRWSLNHWTAREVTYLFIFKLKYSWFTMLCYFQVYSKVIQLYIHVYIHTYIDIYIFFSRFFSIIGYYRILNIVPCCVLEFKQDLQALESRLWVCCCWSGLWHPSRLAMVMKGLSLCSLFPHCPDLPNCQPPTLLPNE